MDLAGVCVVSLVLYQPVATSDGGKQTHRLEAEEEPTTQLYLYSLKKRESVLEVTAVLMSYIIRVSRAETPRKTQIPHSLRRPVRLLTSSRPAPELLIICAGCN